MKTGRSEAYDRFSDPERGKRAARVPVFVLVFFLWCAADALPEFPLFRSCAFAEEVSRSSGTAPDAPGSAAKQAASPGKAQSGGLTPENAPQELLRLGQEPGEAGKDGKVGGTPAEKAGKWGKPGKIRLFGTVEFRQSNTSLQAWQSMLKRNALHPLFTPGSRLNSSTTWDQFKKRAEKLKGLDLLRLVNNFWNNWPYREDRDVYGKPDYWASPREFREKSGDCEDYSIAKYFTLRELGVPKENMRIVVLMETIRNLPHAVLVVYMDDDAYVLDNLNRQVLSHSRYRNYDPRFSINEDFRWAHMKPKK